ncbi:MAG TPA: hypothetical protein VIL48_08225 [Acidimicrobiales bacterium]
MVDPPSPSAGPSGRALDAALDAEALGAQMSGNLLDLVGAWTDQMRALAEAGVDPAPLVRALARTLRAVADQLDPGGTA